MKKFLTFGIVIMLLFLTIVPAFADAASFPMERADFYVYVATPDGGLNMRSGPDVKYDRVMEDTIPDGVRLYINGNVSFPAEWYQWGNIFGLAFFPTVVSLACTTRAIRYIGSTSTAILGAFEPVTAIIMCVLLLGEKLTVQEVGGMMLIILAVTLVVEGGKRIGNVFNFRRMFPKLPLGRNKK